MYIKGGPGGTQCGISQVFVRLRLAPKEQLFCITRQYDRIFLAPSHLSRYINKVRQKNVRRVITKKFERWH